MSPDRIEARAPTRIDLAGGTIDIWPLYLLHDRPVTVNVAIDLMASAIVERRSGPAVEIESIDRGTRFAVASRDLLAAGIHDAPPELEFVARLAAHFLAPSSRPGTKPAAGCRITTSCRAPAGSGLGGSSALGIALASALDRHAGGRSSPERLLAVTRAIETQTLRIPTGEQDYHPALHGGPLALHYTVDGTRVERLRVDAAALRDRLVLLYTGKSRSSGLSNWDMVKRHLDGDAEVRAAMDGVIRATRDVRAALLSDDLDGVGPALAAEWEARKMLSPAVSDSIIDELIRAGVAAGALAGKVCGAGGGGCVVLWTRAGRRDEVAEAIAAAGAEVLDFGLRAAGVEITET